jgi:hypothetical protein
MPKIDNRQFWWANQGSSYEQDLETGILATTPKDDKVAPGRDIIKQVRPGDVVFSYDNSGRGEVKAICVALASPRALGRNESERGVTQGVDVRYFELDTPIYWQDIPQDARPSDEAFDKNGNLKRGFLWPVSSDFAKNLWAKFHDHFPASARSDEDFSNSMAWLEEKAKKLQPNVMPPAGEPKNVWAIGLDALLGNDSQTLAASRKRALEQLGALNREHLSHLEVKIAEKPMTPGDACCVAVPMTVSVA